jgi:hypothetical protein
MTLHDTHCIALHCNLSPLRVSAPGPSPAAAQTGSTGSSADVPISPQSGPKKMAYWGSPTLRIRDMNGNILEVNSEKPAPYESEYFKGVILTMVRCDEGRWEKHFAGKQRKFEVQIQGKMKQLPTGNVMLGGELQEKIEFGLITRTLISILMKFTAKLLPSMRYSLGEAYKPEGKYECPHIASPLFRTMDRVWVTPEGEEPPELGKELPESDADRNLRRGGKAPFADMRFEMDKTYSFSFHSMYLDFGNWVITNVPGYSGLNMKTLVETQSVSVVCYDVPFDPPGKTLKHFQCNKKYLTFMEYSHISVIPESDLNEYNAFLENPTLAAEEAEPAAEALVAAAAGAAAVALDAVVEGAGAGAEGSGTSTPAQEGWKEEDSGSGNDNDDDALTDVPSNSFLPITLLHEDQPAPASLAHPHHPHPLGMQYENAVWPGVGGKNGFAVVREFQEVQNLKFIKLSTAPDAAASKPVAKRSSLRMWPSKFKSKSKGDKNINSENKDDDVKDSDAPDAFWNSEQKAGEKLRNGDIIMVQSATTGEYLTIQRGWWLVWTARSPQSRKGHFIVTLVDHEERVREDPSPLYVGFPFRLRSARWPTWQVGLQMAASPSYGGKLLTLYHPPKAAGGGGDRHTSMDRSMAAFTKSMTADAYSLPAYSSKSVRPLVLSVLPESVCEKYSRETVGMIRSIMSLDAVFRSPYLSSRPALTQSGLDALRAAEGGEEAPPGAPQDSPYQTSSRISLPLSAAGSARDSLGFRDYHNLPLEETAPAAGTASSSKAKQLPYSALSYQYFPRSVMDAADLGGVHFELSGWVEVLNRESNAMQLAYLLSCEIPDADTADHRDAMAPEGEQESPRVVFVPSMTNAAPGGGFKRARRFTVLRTGSQLLETITDILAALSPPGHAAPDPLSSISVGRPDMKKIFSANSADFSSVLGEPDLDRVLSGSAAGGSVSSPARPRGSSGAKSDSSDGEPDWAADSSFVEASLSPGAGRGAETTGDSVFASADKAGSPIDIICPRYQSDADHSFQLLAAFLQMAQTKELLLSEQDPSPSSPGSGSAASKASSQQPPQAFGFPARRLLLRLAASPSDTLTASFVGDIGGTAGAGRARASPVEGKPPADSKAGQEKKKALSMGRNSISSTDLAGQSKVSPLLRTTVVARALWDCHWREEFVQLHSSFVSFFPLVAAGDPLAPGGKAARKSKDPPAKSKASSAGASASASASASAPSGPACLTLLLQDITSVSLMDEAFSKFPGYHILKLESLGRVTYLAFNSLSQCESFAGCVLELKSEASLVEEQGDISTVEGALGDPRDSFVLRSGRWRPQSRMVLNSRRFQFDIEQQRTEAALNNAKMNRPWLISYPDIATDAADAAGEGKGDAKAQAAQAQAQAGEEAGRRGSVPYWELSARLLRDVAFLSAPAPGEGREGREGEPEADGERMRVMGR